MKARALIVLCLILVVVSLWSAAAPLIERLFGQGSAMASSLVAPVADTEPGKVDLSPVLAFSPFGMAQDAPVAAVANAVQSGFVLLGITTAQQPGASRAIISGGDVSVANYGIGDVVAEGVALSDVLADHVVLSVAGQEQLLYFPTKAGAEITATPAVAAAETGAGTFDETLFGQYRAEIVNDAPGLLRRLGLEVTDQGYRVTTAASDEVLGAGLLPGDMVSGVNGKPLGDPALDPALFDEVAALGSANFVVVRGGKSILMAFPLK